ncbi:hypothetical protein NPIL_466051 [Nephila pilipes]|uniref:Uncharacterized protein n=1 Tax=Nephila pilipes TaxID=299642 RepID=A0A8X6PMP7_NEPPI|nr:hypothetical protein NPIL_466051 [Nephila pilipes]
MRLSDGLQQLRLHQKHPCFIIRSFYTLMNVLREHLCQQFENDFMERKEEERDKSAASNFVTIKNFRWMKILFGSLLTSQLNKVCRPQHDKILFC